MLYAATERPPPADSIVNGRRAPTYMLCWKFVIDSAEVEDKYGCYLENIREEFALPRWWERQYADQFGCVLRMKLSLV